MDDNSDENEVCKNLAAQSAMVMMEKRMVTTSIAFHASRKNSPHPFFYEIMQNVLSLISSRRYPLYL